MWATSLPYVLLWSVLWYPDESREHGRLGTEIAPSWSWASMSAHIMFPSHKNIIAAVSYPGQDPLDSIETPQQALSSSPDRALCLRTFIWTETLAGADVDGNQVTPGYVVMAESNGNQLAIHLDCEEIFPLTVTYAPIQIGGTRHYLEEEGLVLVAIPGRIPPSYRRIGTFQNWYGTVARYEPCGFECVVRIE